jgi:plastocyanin
VLRPPRLRSSTGGRIARSAARRRGTFAVAAALAFGCGGEGEPADAAAAPAVAASEPDLSAVYAADAVDVALLEYAIGMPSRLPAGPTVLRLSNQGFEMHNLKLVDPASGDVLWETETDVNTGEVRLVELELSPGSYTVVCDVAGHDSRGMLMTLTVEASPPP